MAGVVKERGITLAKSIDTELGLRHFGDNWQDGDAVLVGYSSDSTISVAFNIQTIDLFVRLEVTPEEAMLLANTLDEAVAKVLTNKKETKLNG